MPEPSIPSPSVPRPSRAVPCRMLLVPLAALLLLTGCAPEPPAEPVALDPTTPRHVFLISVDTLRADRLGIHGYPRDTSPEIDALGERGVVFERAIAQWPKTGASFASMFTGRYPQTTGLTHKAALRIPERYFTLPQAFERVGFTTVAVVSNGVLSDELGWARGFDRYLETWTDSQTEDPEEYRKHLWAGRVNELALPMLAEHADAERLFAWIHYSDPHAPYYLPEGFENPFLDDEWYVGDTTVDLEGTRGKAIGDRRDLRFYVAQYDANVRVVDLHVARLLDHLDWLGLLEDSLVIFTADHGESLGEHDSWFEHGPLPYNTTSWVPLFFVQPGAIASGARIAAPVELVDLYPTLLDLVFPELDSAGIETIEGLEGQSLAPWLRDPALAPADRIAFAEAGRVPRHYRSVQDRRWKLVHFPPPPGRERDTVWELYDLEADPGETVNRVHEQLEQTARLRRQLLPLLEGDGEEASASDDQTLDADAERALKALGYVE